MQVYEKEFSISLTTRTGLVIKQSFEPRRIHSFPLLFLITAELVCERYAQLAETRVMVGYIRVWKRMRGEICPVSNISLQYRFRTAFPLAKP